uniref:Cerato-platanin 1 n=1 Tax=Moniliophthora perniciosa TaxID=153609 RepID=B2C3H8_MONPR|nr:cerato-platanin 1 [Moniliophthora perniciosa]
MKSIAIFTPILILLTISAGAVKLSYDEAYDNPSSSLLSVTCSDGENGLYPKYRTFGDLPGFPCIGGSSDIAGYNSPNCGSCYQLTYSSAHTTPKSIYMVAIDRSAEGFTASKQAMDDLTNKRAEELGTVNVYVRKVDFSRCERKS